VPEVRPTHGVGGSAEFGACVADEVFRLGDDDLILFRLSEDENSCLKARADFKFATIPLRLQKGTFLVFPNSIIQPAGHPGVGGD